MCSHTLMQQVTTLQVHMHAKTKTDPGYLCKNQKDHTDQLGNIIQRLMATRRNY